jgi:hypothetical protein
MVRGLVSASGGHMSHKCESISRRCGPSDEEATHDTAKVIQSYSDSESSLVITKRHMGCLTSFGNKTS